MIQIIQNIKNNRLYVISSLIIFVLLNISYVFDVSPKFDHTYLPFLYVFNLSKFIIISILSIFITTVGAHIKSEFIRLIWFVVLVMQFYSSAILYAYIPDISFGVVFQYIILLLVLFFADYFKTNIKLPSISLANNHRIFMLLSVVLFTPFIYYYWQFISIGDLFLNKEDVSQTRALFRTVNVPFLGYIISPLSRVLFPVLIVYSIKSRKYYLFAISAVAIAYLFLCSATKSVLVGGMLSVFFYYGNRWRDKFKLFSLLLILLLVISFVASNLFSMKLITDAFVRRVFFVPPYLDNIYHFYFVDNFTYWGHSPFGLHLHDVSFMNGKGVSMFIGEDVLNFEGLNANIGIITEGYLSFGFIGVLMHSLAFASIFVYIRILKISPHYFGIVFAYLFYLNSSLLSTLLITHGLLFLLIIFTLFLQNTKDDFDN